MNITQEELAQINRFARTELTEEQVYIFSVRLCDNEVDRDFERFDTDALTKLGELFVGKSGIFDHQWSAQGQTARIYRTEVIREPARRTAAQLLRLAKQERISCEVETLDGQDPAKAPELQTVEQQLFAAFEQQQESSRR